MRDSASPWELSAAPDPPRAPHRCSMAAPQPGWGRRSPPRSPRPPPGPSGAARGRCVTTGLAGSGGTTEPPPPAPAAPIPGPGHHGGAATHSPARRDGRRKGPRSPRRRLRARPTRGRVPLRAELRDGGRSADPSGPAPRPAPPVPRVRRRGRLGRRGRGHNAAGRGRAGGAERGREGRSCRGDLRDL